jgi:hypothetical protein
MEGNNKSLGGRVKYGTSEHDKRICELFISFVAQPLQT